MPRQPSRKARQLFRARLSPLLEELNLGLMA
jgi:hypothetical protein